MELPQVVPAVRPKWLAIGAVAVLLGLVLRTSWVTEDAYITLRTVDNWVNGFGLRWNADERVQAYTHPLWMLLLSAGYVITRESFTTTVFTGLFCTAAAALLLVHFARTGGHAVAAIVLLTLSRGFVEFSTSGLENPLSHLLLVAFIGQYAVRETPLYQLALTAALIALNRIDATIVVMPALLHVSYLELRLGGFKHVAVQLVLGFSPFVAWELFSLLYYGFPFPNTAYAKLNTGLPRLEVIGQGLVYWVNALAWDLPLHVVALAGVVTTLLQRRRRDMLIALGLIGYVVYVIGIGGDFMQGRFWTIPFFVGACLIAISELPLEDPVRAGAVILPFGMLFFHPLATEQFPIGLHRSGVADERSFYRDDSSLVLVSRNRGMPMHPWFMLGRELRTKGERVFMHDNIGFLGYGAGPNVHIIDQLALSEPLLARLPMRYRSTWRVGHYARQVPDGFKETALAGGQCKMTDANLCEYYRKLREIISGPLFSWSRFKTIAAMNLGLYDYLIDRERYRYPELAHERLEDLSGEVAERAPWNAPPARVMQDDGMVVSMPAVSHAKRFEASFDSNDTYDIEFRNRGVVVGTLESKGLEFGLMSTRRLKVPDEASKRGFDSFLVRPDGGDGMFSMGYVRLHDK
jgi:arabinofuranosyltransferase